MTELSRISRRRHILQKTRCRQAAAPEAELAAKMEVAQSSSKDHVAGIADEDDGWVTSMLLSIGTAPAAARQSAAEAYIANQQAMRQAAASEQAAEASRAEEASVKKQEQQLQQEEIAAETRSQQSDAKANQVEKQAAAKVAAARNRRREKSAKLQSSNMKSRRPRSVPRRVRLALNKQCSELTTPRCSTHMFYTSSFRSW